MYAKRIIIYSVLILALLLSACAHPTQNTAENTNTAKINGNTEIIPESFEYTHAVYKINITAECISNDSVGDDWEFTYIMDGQEIKSGHQVIIPIGEAQTKMLTATVKERDKMPDVATEEITFEIRGGEEKRRRLTVTENSGWAKGGVRFGRLPYRSNLLKTEQSSYEFIPHNCSCVFYKLN